MRSQRIRRAGPGMRLLGVLWLVGARLASAADAPPDPAAVPRPAWTALQFEASSWLASVRVEFELRPAPPGPARGGDGASWLSIFRTRLESRILAEKTSETQARFEPATGMVSGYSKLLLGPSPNRKLYEFSRAGAERTRIEPAPGEAGDRPEVWSAVRKSFHPFEASALGCRLLSEPSVLVYEISSGAVDAGGHADGVCMFSGKTLFRLQIDDLGTRTLTVDYEIGASTPAQRRKGKLATECYRIFGQPVAGEQDEDDVHLEFCVDPSSHLPVQLTTGIRVLGTLSVRLVRVMAP